MIRHLLVPGLLGPAPAGLGAADLPRLPGIERLLARADRSAGPDDVAAAAFMLFGIPNTAGDGAYPTAALCYRRDSGEAPPGWVMHADPVYLRPDQDRLLLFDAASMAITGTEADSCVRVFNAHFGDDGIELVAPMPERWYLLADQPPAIRTRPLSSVVGRSIDGYLPVGPDQDRWRQIMNETQMLFFGLAVNEAREADGRPAIAGLWFSGGGRMPARGETDIGSIDGTDPLVDAAADWSRSTGDDELRLALRPMRALLDADGSAWLQALGEIEAGLADWLALGDTHQLHLCNGTSLHWRPVCRRRLWRRARPFASALDRVR